MPVNMQQLYTEVCSEQNQPINPFIAEILSQTEEQELYASTLKLCGNNRLVQVQRVSDEDFLVLAQVLSKNSFITNLDLRYNRVTDNGAAHIATFLQNNSSVLCLNIMGNEIGTDGSEHITKALHRNTTLLSLRMTGNKIGNKGGMLFASMLQINSTLEELDLGDCDLGIQSLIALATVLLQNKTLKSLNLNRPIFYVMQEDTTVHLSEMLRVNSTLQELHLSKHEITDFGVQRLCDALHENHTLKYLNLSWLSVVSNNISGKGLQALAAAIKANNCLLYIYIWGNKINQEASMAFSQLLQSGRLSSSSTDVQPYVVDGRVCLAEIFHGLKKHYYWTPSYGMADDPICNSTFAICNDY
uniref:Leucine rich repeat containing 34 n=1 Tax=Xenopus tropicalis TaxID=8364 RepID=A0A1B8Y5M1_XENTR